MTSRFLRLVFFGVIGVALAAGTVCGQGNSQGKGHGKGHQKHEQDDDDQGPPVKYGFGAHDREIIAGYYANRSSNLPPGLAKRGGNLPPGLEKQLQRNGTLPPGLQKRLQPCPAEVERQLPPLPPDYRRGVIGAHVLIFNKNTNVIVDVLHNVAR